MTGWSGRHRLHPHRRINFEYQGATRSCLIVILDTHIIRYRLSEEMHFNTAIRFENLRGEIRCKKLVAKR